MLQGALTSALRAERKAQALLIGSQNWRRLRTVFVHANPIWTSIRIQFDAASLAHSYFTTSILLRLSEIAMAAISNRPKAT